MGEQQPHPTGKSYQIGDVGAGARVAQGENITWTERFTGDPQGEALRRQFTDLLAQIESAPDLDEDDRALAKDKTEAVANGLANAQREPSGLRRALRDAKGFLTSSAHWVWDGLNQILTSEAAQKTIGTITEAGTKAAIQSLLGMP
jgi:hypothetical protein